MSAILISVVVVMLCLDVLVLRRARALVDEARATWARTARRGPVHITTVEVDTSQALQALRELQSVAEEAAGACGVVGLQANTELEEEP